MGPISYCDEIVKRFLPTVMKRDIVIASAVRTPIGRFLGQFANVKATELGAHAIVAALQRAKLSPTQIEDVLFGCVIQAGCGQNVARQCAVSAKIPFEVPAVTINRVCGSGLEAVASAAKNILLGDIDIAVAGGTECMSQAPHLLIGQRTGVKMGDIQAVDSLIHDGLTDAFLQVHMAKTVEMIAKEYKITRDMQDEYAQLSQNRAQQAQEQKLFEEELVPIEVQVSKKEQKTVVTDEHPRHHTTVESLARLRPAFEKDGTITAGNASGMNDGAAALIVMSKQCANTLDISPLCRIVSYACCGTKPEKMGVAPVASTKKALEIAGLTMSDMDVVEINEAFAAQCIAVMRDLDADRDITNVKGGAIALGHPIGASGARILVTLIHTLRQKRLQYGLATLCVGGGMGCTMIIENVDR